MANIDNLEDLALFCQIVDSGSLSAAGRATGIHKNRVSRRLRDLEAQLDVTLIRRTTRALTLTAEGQHLYEGAKALLRQRDLLVQSVRAEPNQLRGELRMLVPSVTLQLGLVTSIEEVLLKHPDLSLHVDIADEAIDPVRGGYDVVVHVGEAADSTHIARTLGPIRPSLAAAPAYVTKHGAPTCPSELRDHPCLLYASSLTQSKWTLVDAAGVSSTVAVRGRLSSGDSRMLRLALYQGLGIGVRPSREVRRESEAGRLVHVLPDHRFETLNVRALIPQGVNGTARAEKGYALLKEAFSRLAET